MRVLPDTSVWSLALRRKKSAVPTVEEKRLTSSLARAIDDGLVAMIGPIRQELLSGIRDRSHFDNLRTALQAYPDEAINTADYEDAARLYNVCRSRGVECGAVDILICAVAARRKWQVLTNDAALKRSIEVVRSSAQP